MPVEVVFFDLGDTLGSAVLSPPPVHLVGFDVYPFVSKLLSQLRSQNLRLGVISNTGEDDGRTVDSVLQNAAIPDDFESALCVYSHDIGLKKDSPAIFKRAIELAGLVDTPQECLFVGEDAAERAFALQAGMRVCPHPLLIGEVLAGDSLRYVRVTFPSARVSEGRELLRQRPFVPLFVTSRGGTVVYGIASHRTISELANLLLQTDLLGGLDAPNTSDLYLLRDDLARTSGFGADVGEAQRFFSGDNSQFLLSATDEGLLAALPAGRSPGEFHFAEARHGHTLKLIPDVDLLAPASGYSTVGFAADQSISVALSAEDVAALSEIGGNDLLDVVERYSGVRPLSSDDPRPVKSRHIADVDLDNERCAMALAKELERVGGGETPSSFGEVQSSGLDALQCPSRACWYIAGAGSHHRPPRLYCCERR